jgi:hypothetical protein
LLNETRLARKDNFYIKGFDVIHRKGGATAILIINKLKYEEEASLNWKRHWDYMHQALGYRWLPPLNLGRR